MALQAFFCLLLLAGFLQQQAVNAPAPAQSPVIEEHSYRITGAVVDAMSGQPLSGAQVSTSAQGIRDSNQSVVTSQDGRFVFENLAPGHYPLFVRRKGYLEQFYKQHEQFSTAIIVGPDLNSENLRFELRPGASVSGQVLDEMNEPVRNAQVQLFQRGLAFGRRSNWQANSVQTDDLGHYHFGHAFPGTYFVAVSATPWYAQRVTHQRVEQIDSSGTRTVQEVTNGEPELDVVYPITFFPSAPDISGAAAITLRPGTREIADFRLQPVPALHMIVRTSSSVYAGASSAFGDPADVENVWAQVVQPLAEGIQIGVPASTQQIAPGVLEISGLPPGRFSLQLGSNKNGETRSHSQNVQLTGDTELTLSEANSSGTISGVAKLENGTALATPVLLLLRAKGSAEQFPVQADQNGEFSLKDQSLPAGTYDLLVRQPPAVAVKSMTATGAKVSGRGLEVSGGQDVKLKVVLSEGTGRITGFALKDGKAVDGVMVVLVPEVPDHNLVLFRRDQSDSDGSFNLPGVHPGKYTVVAIENGWELDWFTPGVIQKYLAGGEPVQVSANAKIEVKVKVQL
jgi:5-hydroxyisourate hydrolase-like protein (transthyretin family)